MATHLGLAFIILGVLAWYALLLGRSEAALMQARRGRVCWGKIGEGVVKRVEIAEWGAPEDVARPGVESGQAGRGL